jgi:transposase InsO family protein
MCRIAEVSKSGYYDWVARQDKEPTPTQQKRELLETKIEKTFEESRQVFGYRKIAAKLKSDGEKCSESTVRRICNEKGVCSCVKKKFKPKTTDSNHNNRIADNVLSRDFKAENPNEKWVTDITYIETLEGFLFVTVIIDLFSRRVIGWSMFFRMDN